MKIFDYKAAAKATQTPKEQPQAETRPAAKNPLKPESFRLSLENQEILKVWQAKLERLPVNSHKELKTRIAQGQYQIAPELLALKILKNLKK